MVLLALHPSSNYLYTKTKSTILRPLKGEVGYDLAFIIKLSCFLDGSFKSTAFSIPSWLTMLLPFDVDLLYTPI